MHPGQLSVSPLSVATLIAEQFPQWAGLPIQSVPGAGTVNAIFRVGAYVVARFPLVPSDDVESVRQDLELEAAAAEELSGRTPVVTPHAARDRTTRSGLSVAVVGLHLVARGSGYRRQLFSIRFFRNPFGGIHSRGACDRHARPNL